MSLLANTVAGAFLALQSMAPFLAFLGVFTEESGIPTPMPAEVSIGYLGHWAAGLPALSALWLAATSTVVIGDSTLYWASALWGRKLIGRRLPAMLGVSASSIERAERWLQRWGPGAIVVARFLPGVRFPLTIACGIARVPYGMFVTSVALSAAVWVGVLLVAGDVFGGQISSVVQTHPASSLLGLGAMAAMWCSYFVANLARRRWSTRRARI